VDTNLEAVTAKSLHARKPRRRLPVEFKREVVEASLKRGASVSRVARKYDVNANQVFKWRGQYRAGLLAGVSLLPVVIEDLSTAKEAVPEDTAALIEIELRGGRIWLHGAVNAETLRQVVALLSSR